MRVCVCPTHSCICAYTCVCLMGECVIVNDKQEPLVDYRCSINESENSQAAAKTKGRGTLPERSV